ncbi:MAG: hypothetical protein AAB473_01565 [Patescibacteria group bacterium]
MRSIAFLLGFLLLCSTSFVGCSARLFTDWPNDGIQVAQSTTATVLGYSRTVSCGMVEGEDDAHWSWNCSLFRPIRLTPYRKMFVDDRLKPLAWLGSIKLELIVAMLLIFWGMGGKKPDAA